MRGITTHDLVCVLLIWLPGVAGALAAMAGASPQGVFGWAAFTALVCTWTYAVVVARPRRAWLEEVETIAAALWRAVDGAASPPSPGETRPQRAVATLRQAHQPVLERLEATTAELENYRAISSIARSATLATDALGVVIVANRAADEYFARPRSAIVGKNIVELFTHEQVLRQHARALEGSSGLGQLRIARPDGVRVFEVLTAPAPLRGRGNATPQQGVVVTLRDITQLAQAVQLQTDFVANASHELRTPLASIRAATETLADGAWDDGEMREKLAKVITGNTERLEEMVRDLLDLSRLESPDAPTRREPIDPQALCQQLAETFDTACKERRLTLAFSLAAQIAQIESDRALLLTILRNLIENATKYAYEGTTITIAMQDMPGSAARPQRGLRIEVRDRGVGIPVGHQQRIFERFYQVDPARTGPITRRGTGLGLAIVKHAVHNLGGTIRVDSVWKEGTTMTVELPACVVAS